MSFLQAKDISEMSPEKRVITLCVSRLIHQFAYMKLLHAIAVIGLRKTAILHSDFSIIIPELSD